MRRSFMTLGKGPVLFGTLDPLSVSPTTHAGNHYCIADAQRTAPRTGTLTRVKVKLWASLDGGPIKVYTINPSTRYITAVSSYLTGTSGPTLDLSLTLAISAGDSVGLYFPDGNYYVGGGSNPGLTYYYDGGFGAAPVAGTTQGAWGGLALSGNDLLVEATMI